MVFFHVSSPPSIFPTCFQRSKCLLGIFPALVGPVVGGRAPAAPAAVGGRVLRAVGGRRAAVVGPGVAGARVSGGTGVPGVPGLGNGGPNRYREGKTRTETMGNDGFLEWETPGNHGKVCFFSWDV